METKNNQANHLSQHPAIVKAREEHLPKVHMKGKFTLAVGGDIIQTNPISHLIDPDVRGILEPIQNSDVAFANMESNFADFRNQEKHVGGLVGSKDVAADVKAMGFDIVARASNHSTGQGTEQMLKDNEYLQKVGLIYAGTGKNLEDARAPQYLETPKGRVGLVAMVMSQTGRVAYQVSNTAAAGMEMASYQAGNMNGLPGANFLRVTPTYVLVQEEFEALKKMKAGQNAYVESLLASAGKHNTGGKGEAVSAVFKNLFGAPKSEDSLFFNYQWYMAGEERCGIRYTMHEDDLRLNLRSIRQGKEWSDFMIASIHSHDYSTTANHLDFLQQRPSDFIVELAHLAIDNGADAFVVTGPHLLRGIEIYKGKPIFYSLASFIYQLWGTPAGPDRYTDNRVDSYYTETTAVEFNMDMWPPLSITKHSDLKNMESMESLTAECKFDNGQLVEIVLHPIEFGYDAPISQRGIPRVPSPEVATRILNRMQKLSEPFGTKLCIENNLGIIRL